jgi:hypothetical protein
VKAQSNHYPSLFSSILFSLGALLLLGIALFMGMTVLVSLFTEAEVSADQTVPLVAFGFEASVLLAAAFFSLQKFLQKSSADENASVNVSTWQIILLIFVAGLSLLIGYQLGEMTSLLWIILPILTVPAIVFPIVVLLIFGTQKLPFGTRWQTWSVLGLSMTLAPLILFTLEIFMGFIIFAFVVGYLVTQPELVQELQRLSQEIMILGPESEATLELLGPLLTRPGVMAVTLIYIAVLVPAIEEIFKPIGVWLFARQLTPAQGLTLGALSGAGYALIETIGVSAQTSEWASLLFSRIGTGLLHITTSALMGAAIVFAVREKRYLRLIGTYLLAVFLHGLWNSLAIFFTFSTLAEFFEQPGTLGTIQAESIIAMVILVIVLFSILVIANLKMRKTVSTSPAGSTSSSDNLEVSKTM